MALNRNTLATDSGTYERKPKSVAAAATITAAQQFQQGRGSTYPKQPPKKPDLPNDGAQSTTPAVPSDNSAQTGGTTAGQSAGGYSSAQTGYTGMDAYTPDTSAYDTAMAALRKAEKGAPTYAGSYNDQIAAIYAKITGRGDFNYDLNEDALWQQYKDNYVQMGQTAMRDTMGQAAALTGGYGSSYSQAAGQAAYDQYLQQLTAIAPELYDRAYQRYSDEGDALLQQYSMMRDLADDEYSKYQDAYNQWLTERSYAAGQADTEYSKLQDEYNKWLTERSYGDAKREDKLSQLQTLIQMGYTPTEEEIAAAGLTPAQYETIAAYYAPQETGGSGYYVPGTAAYGIDDDALEREYAAFTKTAGLGQGDKGNKYENYETILSKMGNVKLTK